MLCAAEQYGFYCVALNPRKIQEESDKKARTNYKNNIFIHKTPPKKPFDLES